MDTENPVVRLCMDGARAEFDHRRADMSGAALADTGIDSKAMLQNNSVTTEPQRLPISLPVIWHRPGT